MLKRRYRPILLVLPFLTVFLLYLSDSLNAVPENMELSETRYKEDINGDGKQNVTDVIALLLLGRDNPNDSQADYDGNGEYAISDAIALLLNIMSKNFTPVEKQHFPGEANTIQGLKMAFIPAGSFQMGSEDGDEDERPVHEVSLEAFWMSVTEITQVYYESVTGVNPSYWEGEDDNPVERVTWYDAVTFCNKLSEQANLDPCYELETWSCDFSKNGFRLATEAEWEYACRAGTTTEYYVDDSEIELDEAAWHWDNSDGGIQQPVGLKIPNRWYLYDMHGNVWEWCNDWYDEDYYTGSPSHDPTGPEFGSRRVRRGGCACADIYYHRSANREYLSPVYKDQTVGIRVVRRP